MFCPHRSLVPVALTAVLLLTSPFLHAASWTLANGDRLTGALVEENGTHLVIDHPDLGRLTIARRALQGAAAEGATPNSGGEDPEARPDTASVRTGGARPLQWLQRRIEIGYARQDGPTSKQDFSMRLEGEVRLGANSFRGTTEVVRAETERQLVTDRLEANLRWRHDFNPKLFAQSLTTYAIDDVRKINLSLEQQLGAGYRLVDTGRQQVNVGLGVVVQRLARDGYEDGTALLGSVFQDYAMQWTRRLRFTQEATLLVADGASLRVLRTPTTLAAPTTGGDYRFKFNAALETKMTEQLSLNLRYELDHDRSVQESILRTDSRLTTSLGYAW